jgi:hypothetical protein
MELQKGYCVTVTTYRSYIVKVKIIITEFIVTTTRGTSRQ